jgi:hypothetical protein
MDPALFQEWQQGGDFPVTDQGFTSHKGQVERTIPVHQPENTVDELASPQILKVFQSPRRTEVVGAIGVAARAGKRALSRNLDGQGGQASGEDSPPSTQNI